MHRRLVQTLLAGTAVAAVLVPATQAHAAISFISYLPANNTLYARDQVVSDNGRYSLRLQVDGNMVLYDRSRACAASHTTGLGATRAVMQSDANFVVYAGNSPVWRSASTHLSGYRVKRMFVMNSGLAQVGASHSTRGPWIFDPFWSC